MTTVITTGRRAASAPLRWKFLTSSRAALK
jgi:hypothetical protein